MLADHRAAEDDKKEAATRGQQEREKAAQLALEAAGKESELATWLRVARGCLVLAILLVTAFAYTTLFAPLMLFVVRPVSVSLSRKLVSFLFGAWLAMYVFNVEVVNGTRVLFSGDAVPSGERVILICNHRTELDWIYIWCLAIRKGRLGAVKYALKSAAGSYPLFGWVFHTMEFLFLERNWERDRATIQSTLATFKDPSMPLWFIIFPEGTDFSEAKRQRGNEFARDNGLPEVEHLLQPRHRGLSTALGVLGGSIDAVYDVTVAYKKPSPRFSEAFLGRQPTHVYMHVKRYKVDDLPADPDHVSSWLYDVWQGKDRLLTGFYENGLFPGSLPVRAPTALGIALGGARVAWFSASSVAMLYWAYRVWWLRMYVVAGALLLSGSTYFNLLPPPLFGR